MWVSCVICIDNELTPDDVSSFSKNPLLFQYEWDTPVIEMAIEPIANLKSSWKF